MTNKEYSKMTKQASPGSKVLLNCFNAFWVGGLICLLGEGLSELYTYYGLSQLTAASAVSISLITLSIILTALGWYQKIAKFAGAGTLVPITGFANAMSSPAIEFKTEGQVLGTGAKLFSIAGPVIVYGLVSAFLYGLIYQIVTMF